MDTFKQFQIDEPEDLLLCEVIMKNYLKNSINILSNLGLRLTHEHLH